MTARPTTPGASDFPAANLPASASAWGRAVAQRIAQLEAQNTRQDARMSDLNRLAVDTLHARKDVLFNFRGDWVGQTPGSPSIIPIASAYGGLS